MNTKFKAFVSRLNDTRKPKLVDWLLTIALIVFCYFSFNHGDIHYTATHGKDLVECILRGNFFGFYDYTEATAVYSITVYIVFAIWSLPVMLIYKLMGIPIWGALEFYAIPYPVLMWYKLLPTLCYVGISYILYKIVLEMKMDKNTAKWAAFLFISSPIALFSQYIFGQYDSLGLLFTVWALYMFIKKKYYAFSILCAFAITFKLFALFFFIPMLLLIEKRPLHIVKHGLIAMSLYVITSLMFRGSEAYQDTTGFSGNMLPRLFFTGITTELGTISFFVVSMIFICIWAYNKKPECIEEYYSCSIYIPFFAYAALFAFILWHPQWVIVVVPFLTLAIFLNDKTNSSLILHSAMSVGYIGSTVMYFTNAVDANLLSHGIFAQIFGMQDVGSVSTFLTLGGAFDKRIYYSFFAGSLLILMVLYYPANKDISQIRNAIYDKKFFAGDRLFILLRPATVLLFVLPALYMFFK